MEKVSKTLLYLRRLEGRVESLERSLEGVRQGIEGVRQDLDGVRQDLDGVRQEICSVRVDMNGRFATTNDYLREVRDLLKLGLFDKRRVEDLDRRVTALENRRPRRRAS